MQYIVKENSVVLYSAQGYSAVQYRAKEYSVMQYIAKENSIVLYSSQGYIAVQ